MTSATGLMGPAERRSAVRPGAVGFSMVELVLVVALMVLLLGVSAVNFPGLLAGGAFDEAVGRFETTLRMCAAEAASRGRRLQLGQDAAGHLVVAWERRPLVEPGLFEVFSQASWVQYLPADQVVVTRWQVRGQEVAGPFGDAAPDGAPITFFPDGSSDSALVELAPPDPASGRRAVIELDGITGAIRTVMRADAGPRREEPR